VVSLGWEIWRQFNGMPADVSPIEDELQRLLEVKVPNKHDKSEKKENK
jgi:hypothetical protein